MESAHHKSKVAGGHSHQSVTIPQEWIDAIEKEPDKTQKRPWKEEEIEFLKCYVGRKSYRVIAKVLGRHKSQVAQIVAELRDRGEVDV